MPKETDPYKIIEKYAGIFNFSIRNGYGLLGRTPYIKAVLANKGMFDVGLIGNLKHELGVALGLDLSKIVDTKTGLKLFLDAGGTFNLPDYIDTGALKFKWFAGFSIKL